jgi:SNF2 family DNA or RNA helicase
MLEARLKNVGLGFVTVDGASKDRIKLVNQFNEDPAVRVFVGQIDVAGQGINLTGASHVLFLSNNYSYGDRVQAEDRIHRIGQTNNCTYIDVVYRSSVDAAVLRVLQKKENLASMLSNDIIKLV